MNTLHIAQQMIGFNKSAYDHNIRAMSGLHEQTERVINKFWQKAPMFPEEGKKVISDWMTAYKKGCEDLKNSMDDNFKNVEDFFKDAK
jgi:polyhydroxyalkanoate synthesis regulator phasin